MYNWICEVIYLCKMQCGLTQPCRLYALCLITGITDIKCYWWFRFYTPVFCWRLSLKTKEAAGLKDRVASAWVWCVEGCRSAWVWCVEGRRWSRRKPLVWRAVSWVLECGVLKAIGAAEGSRWSEGPCRECLSVVCWRPSVQPKEAAGLKGRVLSAWVWCVEGCRWSWRKPLVWRIISWAMFPSRKTIWTACNQSSTLYWW